MAPTLADLVLFGLFGAFLVAFLAFALAFRSDAAAGRALARVRRRVTRFRWGFLPLLTGIALIAEGQAIRWRAGVPISHPAVMAFHVLGYALLIAGAVTVNLVVWWPRRPRRGAGAVQNR